MRVTKVIGVYRADGGLWGELRYLASHYLRGEGCSLCDITHGALRRKPEWDAAAADLGVPIELRHLNELEPALASFVGDGAAMVVGQTDDGYVTLMTNDELTAMHGDVREFSTALRRHLAQLAG